jgi:hypothetical protein
LESVPYIKLLAITEPNAIAEVENNHAVRINHFLDLTGFFFLKYSAAAMVPIAKIRKNTPNTPNH